MTKKNVWMFVLLFGISSVMVSCNKKGCTDPAAKNYCDKCKKDDGSCQYAIQDYVGTWSVTGNCSAYTMTTSASGSTLTFSKLQNCYTITASVSGNNLTIPSQLLSASTSSCGYPYTVSGSGTLSGTKLTLTYTVKDNGGATTNCSSTCTKK
ncbi:MAG: hypothetical protein AABZ32_01595 [Bacteroidota bacterium]